MPRVAPREIPEEASAPLSAGAVATAAVYPPRAVGIPAVTPHGSLQPFPQFLTSRLTTQEWRRRLIHMSPGLLPGLLLAIPHPHPLAWYSQIVIAMVILGMSLFALHHVHLFERPHETGWTTSVVSFAVITLTLFLGLPARPEIGLAVTVIIAFGDGAATLGGLLFQGPRLPWNNAKSWAGLSTFLLISIPAAALVYWGEARPGVSWGMSFACVAPGALAAAVAESLPLRLNDNVRVGVTASLAIIATQFAFFPGS